jgi:uncharacterized membrane protein
VTWPHVHVVVVHLPVLGLPAGMLLALAGRLRRNRDLELAGLLMIVAAALLGLLAFASGERAEDALDETTGLPAAWVEPHEEAAEIARIALLILAAAAIGTLLVRRDSAALPWLVTATAVFGLVAALLVARAAQLGGRIRHPELRSPPAAAAVELDRD